MKKFYLIIAGLLCLQSLSAQFGVNAYYLNNILNMAPSASSGNGAGIEVFYGPKEKNFSAGFAFSRCSYGTKTEAIKFNTYGYEVNTNLRVNNDFTNISLYSRYKLGKLNNFITPFAEGKFGWGFLSTRLHIEESMDMGGCEPVQRNTVYQDGSWIAYAGGGLDLKLNGIFRKEKEERNLKAYISLTAGYNFGGKVSYFNPEHADKTSGHQHSDVQDYNATFINIQTQELHEHTIGTIQRANLSMAEFKLGIGFRF
jgi:hypothetical protein